MWNGCALRTAQEMLGHLTNAVVTEEWTLRPREQRLCWVSFCQMWVGTGWHPGPLSLVPKPPNNAEQEPVGAQGLSLFLAGERPPHRAGERFQRHRLPVTSR